MKLCENLKIFVQHQWSKNDIRKEIKHEKVNIHVSVHSVKQKLNV